MHWQYFLLKGFSRLLCRLPYRLVLWLGSLLGWLHGTLGRSQRKRAIQQLQQRLGLSESEARHTANRMFANIGKTLLEILWIPALTPARIRRWVTIENPHYLTEAMSKGKGMVILTAHFGTWEWMAARFVQEGIPVAAIAQTQPGPGLDRLLNEYRQLLGMQPYARGNALAAALKALKKGFMLGFLADQDAKQNGIFVDFLGVPASTPQGPAVFALRAGAPVVPAFIVRQPRKGHRILVSPPIYADPTQPETAEIERLTCEMTRVMEDRIRRYPEHWWWFQRRWITTPQRGEESGVPT